MTLLLPTATAGVATVGLGGAPVMPSMCAGRDRATAALGDHQLRPTAHPFQQAAAADAVH